eukprot:jgi/Psemu1/69503/estExt_Genemark1.C_8900012
MDKIGTKKTIVPVCLAFSGSDPLASSRTRTRTRCHRSVAAACKPPQHSRCGINSRSNINTNINAAETVATSTVLHARRRRRHGDDDDATDGNDRGPALPALGPAGSSRINHRARDPSGAVSGAGDNNSSHNNNNNNNTVATFVNPKFSLQYTCKICETKNRVLVSRQAYREGMVVALCKGCDSKHWIADNLDPTLHKTPNIEAYLESKGLGDTLHRVSSEVYEIERVWGLKEGVLTDDSGEAVLE